MKILFVCSSNVCRSPYCEYMFRRMVENDEELKNKVEIKSSAVLNQMKEIDPKTREALIREGFDAAYVDSHKPGVFYKDKKLFDEADVIIGMTKSHKLFLPKKWKRKFVTLSEAAVGEYKAIPDPWLEKNMDKYIDAMNVIKNYLEIYFDKLKQTL
ncbi:MAG: hypothetical protein MJ129_01135 [Clostridia bacterium]|nr:hypothetical protein [Clostridia bacterium]